MAPGDIQTVAALRGYRKAISLYRVCIFNGACQGKEVASCTKALLMAASPAGSRSSRGVRPINESMISPCPPVGHSRYATAPPAPRSASTNSRAELTGTVPSSAACSTTVGGHASAPCVLGPARRSSRVGEAAAHAPSSSTRGDPASSTRGRAGAARGSLRPRMASHMGESQCTSRVSSCAKCGAMSNTPESNTRRSGCHAPASRRACRSEQRWAPADWAASTTRRERPSRRAASCCARPHSSAASTSRTISSTSAAGKRPYCTMPTRDAPASRSRRESNAYCHGAPCPHEPPCTKSTSGPSPTPSP
eukprot:scaffold19670_cov54-Phaeocystis_antarctica.AAC.6